MNYRQLISILLLFDLSIYSSLLYGNNVNIVPVTPNASPEARALLKFFYSVSGRYILTGQHNYPNIKDRNTQFAADYIGKTPAVFSTDWGFAKDGDTDSHLARPDIVKEAIRQHQLGSIVTICWHAVPPTTSEPVTFRQMPGAKPDSLVSVQGQLLDNQFKDLFSPKTKLYKHWCAQVDSIAKYLKLLQDAHVPILWRPYHEMNGNWFWWGGRTGKYSTQKLYKQLFDRLVNYHKLTNLVWVWSVDRPNKPEMQFSNFYPGDKFLDILALDVYGNDFKQIYYDSLVALSNGKPLVLGEVGNPPSNEILEAQPKWGYYVIWAGMVRNTLKKQYDLLSINPRILFYEDTAYQSILQPFRISCGLKPIAELPKQPLDFSGNWIFNEEISKLDNYGASNLPYKLSIVQNGDDLNIKKILLLEFADDKITEEKLTLDGKEIKSEFWNSPLITTANWSLKQDSLIIKSKVTFSRGDKTFEMVTNEIWTLEKRGKVLSINQTSSSFRSERKINMVYNKQ